MKLRIRGTTFARAVWLIGVGSLLAAPARLQAQQSGQLASDILGSTDLAYNPTFFGYSLQAGPTAHSVA